MAKILAIETATKICSIALIEDGFVLGESALNVPHVHVERLVVMINDMLTNLRLKYEDLDAAAVSNGPGSFTGLRIGLSVAKGIAFARDKKIIAVPTLDAIARGLSRLGEGRVIVPLLHARGEEFYYARYLISGTMPKRIGDFTIGEADEIAGEFDSETVFAGEGVGEFSKSDAARKKFGSDSMMDNPASARDVALIAKAMFINGEFSDLRSLVPLYIKDFVAIKGNPLNKLSRLKSGLEKN